MPLIWRGRRSESPGAAGDVAAADHEIAIAAVQTLGLGWEQGFVVLRVGVHHPMSGVAEASAPSMRAVERPRRPMRCRQRARRSNLPIARI